MADTEHSCIVCVYFKTSLMPRDSWRVRLLLAGQMQNEAACHTLETVLRNTSDDCMVRHEVYEAAVGDSY